MEMRNHGETTVKVGRVPFRAVTFQNAVKQVLISARDGRADSIRLANAYCVALASKNPEYAELLNLSGINYPDGSPVAWFMRRLNRKMPADRVRGPSLFLEALNQSREDQLGNFFLGTNADTLNRLTTSLNTKYPGLNVAGTYAPPYTPVSEEFLQTCVDRILATKSDLVWVGLGTPKQDFVATELAKRTGLTCVGVGAAFDFAAGTTNEAPKWVQNSGMEWIYRFAAEPRRLWRRYLFGNGRFVYSAVFESRSAPLPKVRRFSSSKKTRS